MSTIHSLELAIKHSQSDAEALGGALTTVARLLDGIPDTDDNQRDNLAIAVELAGYLSKALLEHIAEARKRLEEEVAAQYEPADPDPHAQAGKHVHTPVRQ